MADDSESCWSSSESEEYSGTVFNIENVWKWVRITDSKVQYLICGKDSVSKVTFGSSNFNQQTKTTGNNLSGISLTDLIFYDV